MLEELPVEENLADLPEPTKKLHRFIGVWNVSGTFHRDGQSHHIDGIFDITPAAGGFGLLGRMTAQVEGLGSYEEWDLLGYDPGTDEYHIFSITNAGATHDHQGEFVTEDRAEFTYKGLQEHMRFREEGVIEFKGEDEFNLSTINRVADKVVFEIHTVLKRNGPHEP